MFDIGTGEMLALAVLALLVLGPEKLPRYAADAARFLRQLRNLANDARSEVTKELGPELEGLNLSDINPRALMRKHLLDGLDDDDEDDDGRASRSRPSPRERAATPRERAPTPRERAATPRERAATPGEPSGTTSPDAPYDPDTT